MGQREYIRAYRGGGVAEDGVMERPVKYDEGAFKTAWG